MPRICLAMTPMRTIIELPDAQIGALKSFCDREGISRAEAVRWAVADGPTDDTRVVTVRVLNEKAPQYRHTELSTVIRQW